MSYQLRLKSIRQSRDISQEQMAEMMDMKLSTYRSWEQGVSRISLENACKLAQILGTDPNDLCGWYVDHPRPSEALGPSSVTPDESRVLARYRSLSLSSQIAASAMLDGLADRAKASAGGSERLDERMSA